MIGILTYDYCLCIIIRGQLQSIKDVIRIGINRTLPILLLQEFPKLQIILFFEFLSENRVPAVSYLNHEYSITYIAKPVCPLYNIYYETGIFI